MGTKLMVGSLSNPVLRANEVKRVQPLFEKLAETFQALGDRSRVSIVWALSKQELNVGQVAQFMKMSQPAVSHHLRTLRQLRLVKVRKVGRTSFYALDDDHIDRILIEGLRHVEDLL